MTDKKRLTVYVSEDVREKVEKESNRLGVTVSGFLNVLISERFRQNAAMDMVVLAKKLAEMQSEKDGSLLT